MQCPYCGAALPDGAQPCGCRAQPSSAAAPRQYWLHITAQEAAQGVQKQFSLSDGIAPVILSLPAGTVNGTVVHIPHYQVIQDGVVCAIALQVHVLVQPPQQKPKRVGRIIIAACILLALVLRGTPLVLDLVLREQRGGRAAQAITAAQARETAAAEIPHFEKRAYLQQLSPSLLANFTLLYESAATFGTRCSLDYPVNADDLDALVMLLYLECPELIQLDFSAEEIYSYTIDGSGYATVHLRYCMEPSEYAAAFAECDAAVKRLCGEMAGMTDYEKELHAYDYITANCTYRLTGAHVGSAYGTLAEHAAKCDGISLAMKWVMEEAGISCLCITGREVGQEIGHAWNIIELDGQYYDLDLTADVTDDANPVIMHCAVNVSSQFLRGTLVPDSLFRDYVRAPGTPSMAKSYHALNGSYFAAGEDADGRMEALITDAYEAGVPLCVQFEAEADYRSFLQRSATVLDDWSVRTLGHYIDWDGWYSEEYRTFCFVLDKN